MTATSESTCRHCGRSIVNVDGYWIDPNATGDDAVWRETCDSHDTFVADHEPVTPDVRWNVVDCVGTAVITGMYRRENAQQEADELNETGVPEGRPYRVEAESGSSEEGR